MPDDLKAKVASAAEANGRSVHAELLHRLQASFEQQVRPDPVERLEESLDRFIQRQGAKDAALTMVRQLLAENLLQLYEALPADSIHRARHRTGALIARAVAFPGAAGLEDVLIDLVGSAPEQVALAHATSEFVRETQIDFGDPFRGPDPVEAEAPLPRKGKLPPSKP